MMSKISKQRGQSTIEAALSALFLIGFFIVLLQAAVLLFQIIYWNKMAYEILLCHLNSQTAHACTQKIFQKPQPALTSWNLKIVKQKVQLKQGVPEIFMQFKILERFNYEIHKKIDQRVWK